MVRKSDIENAIEVSFKYPLWGIVISIFSAGVGLYFTSKSPQDITKPTDMFADTVSIAVSVHFGKFFFWIAGFFLLISVIGFIWQYLKKRRSF